MSSHFRSALGQVKPDMIAAGDWEQITALSAEGVAAANA